MVTMTVCYRKRVVTVTVCYRNRVVTMTVLFSFVVVVLLGGKGGWLFVFC